MTTPLQAPPYGRDTSCTGRMRPGTVVSGGLLLGQAAYRRLITDRGSLLDDGNYGLNLSRKLGADVTTDEIATYPGQIRAELLKDPRLEAVAVNIAVQNSAGRITLNVEIRGIGVTGEGFALSLHVSDVRVELLSLEAA